MGNRNLKKNVKQKSRIIVIVSLCILLMGYCANRYIRCDITGVPFEMPRWYTDKCDKLSKKDIYEYETVIQELCGERLWSSRDAYDSMFFMMIPMYYAFRSSNENAIVDFSNLFSEFVKEIKSDSTEFDSLSDLYRLQFLYLSSQYLILATTNNKANFVPADLDEILENYAKRYLEETATWGVENTVEEHIKQICNGKKYKYNFYSALTDMELLDLGILCDLKGYHRCMGKQYLIMNRMQLDMYIQFLNLQI